MFKFIMILIILIIIIIIIINIIAALVKLIKLVFKLIVQFLKFTFILSAIILAVLGYKITIPILLLWFIGKQIINITHKKKIKRWIKEKPPIITDEDMDNILVDAVSPIKKYDKNDVNYKFDNYKIPYGRVNAFLNYFGKTIEEEEIYYFSPVKSLNDDEIREYGSLITKTGIYIADCTTKKLYEIPFKALWRCSVNENYLLLEYINIEKRTSDIVEISKFISTIDISELKNICDKIIESKIPHIFSKYNVFNNEISEVVNNFNKNEKIKDIEKISDVSGVIGAQYQGNKQYSEVKNFMNANRGNGYAAEYGNNTIDKIKGKNVVNAAQQLDQFGRQVKHGADRIVNNQNIQTKYYKTASESIGAAFKNKQAIYLNSDGSMMPIEVPRDQYKDACKIMQRRIDLGQVPNVKPGENARDYVKKGAFTYSESFNICKSGTIESLTIDGTTGVICSSIPGGISAAIAFATAVWNGKDLEEAAKVGIYTGIRVLGKGTLIYSLTMQLSRKDIVNPFLKEYTKGGIYKGFSSIDNPIFKLSENITNTIIKSDFAKKSIGQAMGLQTITNKAVVSTGITSVILFGPDICKALSGKISTKQLFKNTTSTAASIGGGIIGQSLIPVPIVGAMIGGMVGGFIAKSLLDDFVEEDAKEMFQILKEEFLDVVMVSNLSKKEFDEVVNYTIGSENLERILQEMYASNEYRQFAREAIISQAVINVISKRKYITNDMVQNGYYKMISNSGV